MESLEGKRSKAWRFLPLFLAIVAMTALVAAACGGDDDDDGDDPTATATATATSETGGNGGDSQAAYPVTVTDLLGREVEIKAKPTAVVGLSPTAVEMVYAVGGKVVGRVGSADHPEEAQQATDVGTAYQPSFETILSLKPDLIVADSVIQAGPDYRGPLEQLGVPVIFAGAESYDEVLEALGLMGEVFDAKDASDKAIADIEEAKDAAKAAIESKNVSAVAMIAGRDQTLYAAKDSSYVGDLLNQVGITNSAAGQPDSGPFPGYSTLAPEKLVEYNPDIIFTISPGSASGAPLLSEMLPRIPGINTLHAVTSGNVQELDVELFLEAPGPRVTEAFKALTDAVNAAGS